MLKTIVMTCLLSLAGSAVAAVNSVAGLANPLDNAGASARALGMGSAYVGVADDSSALFWNPSGLGGLKNTELALHHNSWLAGIIQETLVLGLPMGGLGGFGVSGSYVNYGNLPGYDDNGAQVAEYSANRYGAALGWGKEVMPKVFAGASLKGAIQSVADATYSDVSLALGALWVPLPELRLGLAYSNLGTQVAGYSQAADLRAGGSYHWILSTTNQLLLAASGSFEPQGVSRLQVGAEDMVHSFLALRIGYQASLAETQIDGLTGLTAGLGAKYEGFGLDYAFLPYGDLGSTHRISLSYLFGRKS